tara:strand:- start:126 stop:290 length:165 start_codon:yes stop_codon:yes gene_type:complete
MILGIYLDKRLKKIEGTLDKLKKNSHPQADWVCLECGCNAKRKENPTKKGDSNE